MLGERPAVAADAVARRVGPGLAVDVGDAAVAGADQVQRRDVAAEELARDHRGERVVGHVAVEQHRRRAPEAAAAGGSGGSGSRRRSGRPAARAASASSSAASSSGSPWLTPAVTVRPCSQAFSRTASSCSAHQGSVEISSARKPIVVAPTPGDRAPAHGRGQGVAELARRLAHPLAGRGRQPRLDGCCSAPATRWSATRRRQPPRPSSSADAGPPSARGRPPASSRLHAAPPAAALEPAARDSPAWSLSGIISINRLIVSTIFAELPLRRVS